MGVAVTRRPDVHGWRSLLWCALGVDARPPVGARPPHDAAQAPMAAKRTTTMKRRRWRRQAESVRDLRRLASRCHRLISKARPRVRFRSLRRERRRLPQHISEIWFLKPKYGVRPRCHCLRINARGPYRLPRVARSIFNRVNGPLSTGCVVSWRLSCCQVRQGRRPRSGAQ